MKSGKNYQRAVERNMAKWFEQSGDYSGTFVRGSVEWGKMQNEVGMIACAHYFTFQHEFEGEVYQENGKVQARFYGNDILIQVMLYT
jgi:hypothetical protein